MLEIIKVELMRQIQNIVENGYYKTFTYPSVNEGYSGEVVFKDKNHEDVSFFPSFSNESLNILTYYFKEKASKRESNCVEFIIEKGQISEIKEYWDEKIIEDFNANLPKSKRGKIKAWYDE